MKTVTVLLQAVPDPARLAYHSDDPGRVAGSVLPPESRRRCRLGQAALAEMLLPGAYAEALHTARRIADNAGWGERNGDIVAAVALRIRPETYPACFSKDLGGPLGLARNCLLLALDIHRPFPLTDFRRSAADPRIPPTLRGPAADMIRSLFPGQDASVPVTREIRALAGMIYHTQDRSALSPLSDLLEDEGAEPCVLETLRNPNSAVRGNWVLDAILGKR